jgi:F-type H+-transporting ATPase subunit b
MEFNATFFVSAISFIIFTILMNIILYRPLEKIVDEREDFISKNYTDAKDADNKSKSLLQDKADKLAKSKLDAKSLITEKDKRCKFSIRQGYKRS